MSVFMCVESISKDVGAHDMKQEFYRALKRAISEESSAYKQFELDFVWKGDELISFRQQLLPAGTTSSRERAVWMTTFRSAGAKDGHFHLFKVIISLRLCM